MVAAALSIARLPANATVRALRSATSPSAINALSLAIAQGAFQTVNQDETITVEGLNVEVDFNEKRLLSTAGISSAIAIGSVYWIGSKLKMSVRYAKLIEALEELNSALKADDAARSRRALETVDLLSNPTIDPDTLEKIDASEEVADLYRVLFNKPAENGSMFNASNLTKEVGESLGARAGRLAASEATEEAIEAMIVKARPIAQRLTSRFVGAVLWVDTVFWLATSALDLGLNYAGIEEEDQRIPILADLPFIGALFDLSDSVGSSFVDLVIEPIFSGVFEFLGLEDEKEALFNTLWTIITSAALNPTLAPFIISILTFYIEDLNFDFEIPVSFSTLGFEGFELDLFGWLKPEPIEILIAWLYAITIKIVIKNWVLPAYRRLTS